MKTINREPLFGLKMKRRTVALHNFLRRLFVRKYKIVANQPIPLMVEHSTFIPELKLFRKASHASLAYTEKKAPPSSLLVGTVRMGYGHHRMAHAIYTWALGLKIKNVYLHDLLAIESGEAQSIADIDKGYSYMSRLSAAKGGMIDRFWENFTSSGDVNSLNVFCTLAETTKNLMTALPRDLPIITSYPLNGQIAYQAGFTNIVNMVPDNFPQYFLLVPGAINLVQTQESYDKCVQMGIPKENLVIAGHYVSYDICQNINKDSNSRIKRAKAGYPRRLLLPIGGAGAQFNLILDFIFAFKDKLKKGEMHFYINTGDHIDFFTSIQNFLLKNNIPYDMVHRWQELKDFCQAKDLTKKPEKGQTGITLFHFERHFEAFAATDHLMRVADIMVTKPSELAFFPIPKLHIHRVGKHEAAAAEYSAKIGDGTKEMRETEEAVAMMRKLTETNEYFIEINKNIMDLNKKGVYDGAKVAIELAMKAKKEKTK